jgi:hypothetical protein
MGEALRRHGDAAAAACVDARTGMVLGLSVREGTPRDVVRAAATSAVRICVAPCLDGLREATACDEAFLVCDAWSMAFARAPGAHAIVVGVAPGGATIGLLLAWVKGVAVDVGGAAP